MAGNTEDMIIDGMVAGGKTSQKMQNEFNLAEYLSKGTETEYMRYPKLDSNSPHVDRTHKSQRRGWSEFTKGLENEVAGWWDVRFGDPVTYDSRGHKIGFSYTGEDMRPKGERVPGDREGMIELKFANDYSRANYMNHSPLTSEAMEYIKNENILADKRKQR